MSDLSVNGASSNNPVYSSGESKPVENDDKNKSIFDKDGSGYIDEQEAYEAVKNLDDGSARFKEFFADMCENVCNMMFNVDKQIKAYIEKWDTSLTDADKDVNAPKNKAASLIKDSTVNIGDKNSIKNLMQQLKDLGAKQIMFQESYGKEAGITVSYVIGNESYDFNLKTVDETPEGNNFDKIKTAITELKNSPTLIETLKELGAQNPQFIEGTNDNESFVTFLYKRPGEPTTKFQIHLNGREATKGFTNYTEFTTLR